jgi:GntR family transcriptional regulator / MocR family aminotransferase
VLEPGARLPSRQVLAAQLGVARHRADCVREAGCRPVDRRQRPRTVVKTEPPSDAGSFMRIYQEMTQGPTLFQMGIPATETFPATLFARIRAHAVRAEASASPLCPDPRGELELRREIAGYFAVARGHHLLAIAGHYHWRLQRTARPSAERSGPGPANGLDRDPRLPVVQKGTCDRDGRVIHIGSFSKTISPSVRLGFLITSVELTSRFADVAACLAPRPLSHARGPLYTQSHEARLCRQAAGVVGLPSDSGRRRSGCCASA